MRSGARARIALMLSIGATACATVAVPPGGPPDDAPPNVVQVTPDSGAVNASPKEVVVRFDEVVAEQGIEQFLLLSPSSGGTEVGYHRDRLTISPRGGLRPNTAYRVTILPGVSDLRGHRSTATVVSQFSTGPVFPAYSVTGRIFDWNLERPALNAVVQAVARLGPRDSLIYSAAPDSTGLFSLGPLPPGQYDVRGFIDANNNRSRDPLEKWAGVTATAVAEAGHIIELLAIERDTVPPTINGVSVLDSVSVKVTFTRPLDPVQPLQAVLFRVQRSDSSEIQVTGIVPEAQDAEQRRTAEAKARADSIAANDTTKRPLTPPVALPVAGTQPPRIKPTLAPPINAIVLHLASPVPVGQAVIVSARGLRGIMGTTQPSTRTSPPRPK